MKKKDLRFLAIILGLIGALASCDIGDKELGSDILPPGDNVIVYHDTIFEIDTYTMRGKPVATSELSYSATRLMLLGSLEDSIIGKTDATVVAQFNTTAAYRVASNLEIDSLFLAIHVYDFLGDMEQEITLTVHEFTERIFMDSVYYSDFSMEGKYDPVPLVQQTGMQRQPRFHVYPFLAFWHSVIGNQQHPVI